MAERPGLAIQWRLGGAFALALGICVLVVILSYRATNQFISSSREASAAGRMMLELEQTLSLLQDAETGQRGYLLTGDDAYLAPYYGALRQLAVERNILHALPAGTDSATVQRIGRLIDAKQEELRASIEAYRSRGRGAALAIVRDGGG